MRRIFLMSIFAMLAFSLFAVSASALEGCDVNAGICTEACNAFISSEYVGLGSWETLSSWGSYQCRWIPNDPMLQKMFFIHSDYFADARNIPGNNGVGIELYDSGVNSGFYMCPSAERLGEVVTINDCVFKEAGVLGATSCTQADCSLLEAAVDFSGDIFTETGTQPECIDADGDSYLDAACGGDDCNDQNADVHPGAVEIIGDAYDNDCDGTAVCDSSAGWANHGQYVNCVARETSNRDGEVALAAKSITGKAIFGDGETTWLGLTSMISIIALVVVALSAFGKLRK